MKVGVIGSGAIGPDLAYGFVSALSHTAGAKVFLHDIDRAALDAGKRRIDGYMTKAMDKGKLKPKVAEAITSALVTTLDLADLKDCDYVLEAASEDLQVKKSILAELEDLVRPDCLIGFATSGIPRARIAAGAKHPERCYVNHPFYPAWRSPPVEVVPSGHRENDQQMLNTLIGLGKVPVVTADVVCFAADDLFANYCAEAGRIVEEGLATPVQVDAIVNDAIGGGGPFNVMDLTRANAIIDHCMTLMRDAAGGAKWLETPQIFADRGMKPWIESTAGADAAYDDALKKKVLDRILGVLLARAYFVVDKDICSARDLNWLTKSALGFRPGLLEYAEKLGAEQVYELCGRYAAHADGFVIPDSIAQKKLPSFWRNVTVEEEGDIAVVTVTRPEAMNALNAQTIRELDEAFAALAKNDSVKGIVLTAFKGNLAGADIKELATLKSAEQGEELCLRGQAVTNRIAASTKPVVAAVDGPVLGGGCEMSMAAHARVVGKALMLGQPEVNLGIIPGYGGTQRLPRLIGLAHGMDLLQSGRPVGAKEACEWGWAHGDPVGNIVAAAKALIREHLAGRVKLAPVDAKPMDVPDTLPVVDIGYHSRAIDAQLLRAVRDGLSQSLPEGLKIEAKAFAQCTKAADFAIGMKNFVEKGPRSQAEFVHS